MEDYKPLKRVGETSFVGDFVCELFNARTTFHILHLKIIGTGSFAAHKALNEIYDALPGLADGIAESYQGATNKILTIPVACPKQCNSVDEALMYLEELYKKCSDVQNKMPYSDIVNDIDNIKSLINSIKYKLKFLS